MYKTIQILAQLGQNASIKQYQTVQEMLSEQKIPEQEIKDLIESNIPLVCAWIPQENEPDEEKERDKEKDKDCKNNKDESNDKKQ